MDLAKRPAVTAVGLDVAHRVNAERVVLLGWGRAILLQLAHPLVAAGVHDHSSVRATPWAAATRLHTTVRAMLALTFGTDAERQHALYGIQQIHRRVRGHLPTAVGAWAAGTAYSAEDPALVLWVHLTLLESVPCAIFGLSSTPPIAVSEFHAVPPPPLLPALAVMTTFVTMP